MTPVTRPPVLSTSLARLSLVRTSLSRSYAVGGTNIKPQTVATGKRMPDIAGQIPPAEKKDTVPWQSWLAIAGGMAVAGFGFGYWSVGDKGVAGGALQKEAAGRDRGKEVTGRTVNSERRSVVALALAPTIPVPGEGKSTKSTALEAGSAVMQDFAPIKKIHEHVCGFHFFSGNIEKQVEAHHFCSHLSEDFRQCAIYDGNGPEARLIGIEYIVSENLFKSLPANERKYWHSHRHEVMGGWISTPMGSLVPRAVRDEAELRVMQELVGTYGKTVHTWDVVASPSIPLGPPHLMMAFTAPDQPGADTIAARDRLDDRPLEELRRMRAQRIKVPGGKVGGADAWERGEVVTFQERVVN